MLADGTTFEGEADRRRAARRAWPPARSCSTRCCPATRRSSPTRPTPGRSSPSPTPTSATTGSPPTDDESRRPVLPRAWSSASWPAAAATGGPTATSTPSCAATACPASPASTPAGSPATSATRAPCPARSAPPTRSTLKAAAAAEPGTDGIDLVAEVTTRRALHVAATGRHRRAGVVAYDFGIKTTILRHLAGLGHGRGRARRRRRPPRCWPASPTACSSPTAPATRRRSLRRRRHPRPARRGAGLRHLPRPPAARHRPRRRAPTSCRSATTAATTRCAASPPARSRSPARTTTTPSSTARWRRAPRSPTSTSTTAWSRASRAPTCPAFSVQYHPEAGPGPHDARLPVRRVRRAHGRQPGTTAEGRPDAQAHRHRVDPADRVRARSSSARRASSTTRAPRPAGCCARRATG